MLIVQNQGFGVMLVEYIYLFLGISTAKSRKPCLVILNKIYVTLLCVVLCIYTGFTLYAKIASFHDSLLPTVMVLDTIAHSVTGVSSLFFIIFAAYARRNSIRNLCASMESLELTFIKRFRFKRDKHSGKIFFATFLLYETWLFAYFFYNYKFVYETQINTYLYVNTYIMSAFVLQVAKHLSDLRVLVKFYNKKLEENLYLLTTNSKQVNTNIFLKSYFNIWSLIESINYAYGYQIAFVALRMVVEFLNNINHFVKTLMGLQINDADWTTMAVANWWKSCLFMVRKCAFFIFIYLNFRYTNGINP